MMKQMTIKKKITLWYTGIIALILGMVLGFMFYFVDKVGISATEEEVSTAVTGFSSNFQFQDGTYYLSEDTKFYEDGVMFCVYDDNGKLLYGTMPEKFPKQTMLKSHTPRVIKSGSSKWMVYDSVYTYGQNKVIWIRGITSIHAIEVFMITSQKMMLVLYPLFILLIGMTGYFMLKRALKQVDRICDQVETISYGKDLAKRLPLPKARDELYELSQKFNQMFERLEQSFEKEQQFTADVSHELRTPVTVIISQCEYLIEDPTLEKEEKEEKKRLVQKKRELHSELNSLLKTNNVNNDSLNLGISARDLAKWKEKSKKFSSEVDKSSPRKNTFKEKSDDKEYPSSQNNSPPKPISEQKESTEEQKIATENQEVNAGQELFSKDPTTNLFSKDPTTNLFSKEMDEEELNDEDVEDATAGVNGGIADDLKVPHLIGHLTELMANSEEDLKKDLKDTQKELQEKFKEDFKKEFNEDLEESFNRFQENLGRSLKNQSIVDKTQLTEIHEDFAITKEHLEDTKRLLENIVDNNNSEKVTELLQQISEVSNTISKDQLDTKEELTILIKKVEGALAEFSKDTNEKLAINSDVLAEIKKVE